LPTIAPLIEDWWQNMNLWYIVSARLWRLFWILFLPLIVLVVRNYMQGQSLLGLSEFILIGLLIVLAIAQEFASYAMLPSIAARLGDKILVNVLTALAGREEALAAMQKQVDLQRDLARRYPDEESVTRGLAEFLHDLANVLNAFGRREEALAAAQEAEHLRPKK
jgi:tetratricopeptide (TPR) repeat protein